ncbi:MAG TPA: cupredoxin domain-containing protein [Candidatus Binatus sp.]|uniref:cupredoxin domain-containing protein n=1 Tax=Candidatus Binatus sp. TaxID=2811406 RepID=UPI002B460E79|nr:cupredoxin domain-containing protein [Candidatus Binatus sp.]HKN14933.1 cupredoxin domain-containing protein [Candidatus Binatus sp.]
MTVKTSSTISTTAIVSLALLALFVAPWARAADDSSQLRFHAGAVEPASLTLPANTPIKLQVTNSGDAAVEFESFELHRERVVQPGQTITVYLPALPPGTYPFFDDFSHGAVKGEIVSR